jgi:hypothetical protein
VGIGPLIGMGSFGAAVRRGALVISLAATFFTETLETERESTDFGTLSISRQF